VAIVIFLSPSAPLQQYSIAFIESHQVSMRSRTSTQARMASKWNVAASAETINREPDSFRAIHPCHPHGPQDSFSARSVVGQPLEPERTSGVPGGSISESGHPVWILAAQFNKKPVRMSDTRRERLDVAPLSGATIPAYTISIRLTISPNALGPQVPRRIGPAPVAHDWLRRQTVPIVWVHPADDER